MMIDKYLENLIYLVLFLHKKHNIDIEIIDILKDKANLQFKRDSEAVIEIEDNKN